MLDATRRRVRIPHSGQEIAPEPPKATLPPVQYALDGLGQRARVATLLGKGDPYADRVAGFLAEVPPETAVASVTNLALFADRALAAFGKGHKRPKLEALLRHMAQEGKNALKASYLLHAGEAQVETLSTALARVLGSVADLNRAGGASDALRDDANLVASMAEAVGLDITMAADQDTLLVDGSDLTLDPPPQPGVEHLTVGVESFPGPSQLQQLVGLCNERCIDMTLLEIVGDESAQLFTDSVGRPVTDNSRIADALGEEATLLIDASPAQARAALIRGDHASIAVPSHGELATSIAQLLEPQECPKSGEIHGLDAYGERAFSISYTEQGISLRLLSPDIPTGTLGEIAALASRSGHVTAMSVSGVGSVDASGNASLADDAAHAAERAFLAPFLATRALGGRTQTTESSARVHERLTTLFKDAMDYARTSKIEEHHEFRHRKHRVRNWQGAADGIASYAQSPHGASALSATFQALQHSDAPLGEGAGGSRHLRRAATGSNAIELLRMFGQRSSSELNASLAMINDVLGPSEHGVTMRGAVVSMVADMNFNRDPVRRRSAANEYQRLLALKRTAEKTAQETGSLFDVYALPTDRTLGEAAVRTPDFAVYQNPKSDSQTRSLYIDAKQRDARHVYEDEALFDTAVSQVLDHGFKQTMQSEGLVTLKLYQARKTDRDALLADMRSQMQKACGDRNTKSVSLLLTLAFNDGDAQRFLLSPDGNYTTLKSSDSLLKHLGWSNA